jgi:hydroxymethylpyrimidine pyrophosphatase-like HAD family hydrolase/energy-coupling factor transporter ATP-binding protein EcfA2
MRFLVLACDYDGTLATDGRVDEATVAALRRVRESGRRLVMVTGRELDDLMRVCPRLDLFDLIVAENGALLYRPGQEEAVPLAEPPPAAFVAALRARGVAPLSVGRVIVATWEPHQTAVLDTIRDLGLEAHVIFNKGAVMVLPSGVNKATGLAHALGALGLSAHNAVGIGDAENDLSFLAACACGVAVANALPSVKERADVVTRGDHGAGVVELIAALVGNDLRTHAPRLRRHDLLLGQEAGGREVSLPAADARVLVAGPSGSGKSTLTTGLLERLIEAGYQVCLIDPEGDYDAFPGMVTLGDEQRPPNPDEIMQLLEQPSTSITINLFGLPLADRPAYLSQLLPRVQQLRARTGRPHWLVLDEAHHLLPAAWEPAGQTLPREGSGLLLITVHPGMVAPSALAMIETVIAIGAGAERTLADFSARVGRAAPPVAPTDLPPGEALVWPTAAEPTRVMVAPGRTERRRHRRKYAEGVLPPERSFYFRGPDGALNLRAQNLQIFIQMAAGVDDATWLHHLRAGDYTRWFGEAGIKDDELAAAVAAVARDGALSAQESRARVRHLIEQRYTLPA